jgi:hypothetical protein
MILVGIVESDELGILTRGGRSTKSTCRRPVFGAAIGESTSDITSYPKNVWENLSAPAEGTSISFLVGLCEIPRSERPERRRPI